MKKVEMKRGIKFEICGGKYADWYGEVLAVSKEMGMALVRDWFGNHFGPQNWVYLEDLEKEIIWQEKKCTCCGKTL